MSAFDDLIEEMLGDDDALSDIRITVRRLWFYDFAGYPIRMWQGQGKLFTSDGHEWLGTIDANGTDHHKTPSIQDGRDGSSATYNTSMTLFDIPGQTKQQLYESMKSDQSIVFGRSLTAYLAIFKEGEALRPSTPISFFKELTMQSPKFAESIEERNRTIIKKYTVSITSKDGNFGRSNTPNGTYADTIQKQRAKELGVTVDKGSEYLALLANRTYQIP